MDGHLNQGQKSNEINLTGKFLEAEIDDLFKLSE